MKIPEGAVINVTGAEHLTGHTVRLVFSDQFARVINFEPFLKESRNPLIRAYLDPEKFAGFSIKHGDLVWGDYDLCFPIADLYEDNI